MLVERYIGDGYECSCCVGWRGDFPLEKALSKPRVSIPAFNMV